VDQDTIVEPPDEEPDESVEELTGFVERLDQRERASERYVSRGRIAHGGMGEILRVWDADLRRDLAMKVALRDGNATETIGATGVGSRALGRFLEEAQVTGQLDHPGIVPVHEIGIDDEGRVYFTMRLITGDTVERVLEKLPDDSDGEWTTTRVVGIVLKVCQAMAYAHSKGVIHRDLKPANVMVGGFGEAYVMDWGLARVVGDDGQAPSERLNIERASGAGAATTAWATLDGEIIGTPAYMAPEQGRGELDRIGPLVDVYSVGCMLYHLLAGHAPYCEGAEDGQLDAITVWTRLRSGPPRPIHEAAPDQPAELHAICERAMAREPEDRYASMRALADDLRAYLEGRVVQAYETGALAELRKWIGRNKSLALTVLIGAATILVGTTAAAWTLRRKNFELEESNRIRRESELAAIASAERASTLAELADERAERVLRLSDQKRLDELADEAEALWPALPAMVERYDAWLADARAVEERLPEHRAALAELRSRALPPDGARDGSESASYAFAELEDAWQHDVQAELVDALTAFAAPGGPIEAIEARRGFASTIHERSIASPDAARRWREASAAVARSGRFGDFELRPQIGLWPLGTDPTSGLEEFAHLQTGAAPERGPDGRLVIGGEHGLVFVLVPGGRFWMGAQDADPAGPVYDPDPQELDGPVEVELAPFLVSKYELTQGQWLRVTGSNPSSYASPDRLVDPLAHPVEMVSWDDAVGVLERLALTLPTEAQWEYAARAGTETPWWTGFERETLIGAANLADRAAAAIGAQWVDIAAWPELDDGYPVHAPVGSFPANGFGLHDTIGNVWEWCWDDSGSYDRALRPGDGRRERDPDKAFRINRGGSFSNSAARARSSYRNATAPSSPAHSLGLRPVRPFD